MRWHVQLGALVALVAAACSTGGLANGVYRGEGFAFRFAEPARGWRAIDAAPAAVAYRNESTNASMMVNARCGLDGDDVPLLALTNHLFLMFTDREIERQEVVPFDEREAMHTLIDAKLDGVPMRYDVWVLKKDGCVYDLLYLAPRDSFGEAHASFESLRQSFATVDAHGK
jgi:hypothetical protein